MSAFDVLGIPSKTKGAAEATKSFLDDRSITKKIPRVIYKISAVILVFVYLQQYWNISGLFHITTFPLLDFRVTNIVVKILSVAGVPWLVYRIIGCHLVRGLIAYCDSKTEAYIRYYYTVDDIFNMLASMVFLTFSLDELLFFAHNGTIAFRNRNMYVFSGVYLVALFVIWIHRKNDYNPYVMQTDYYDSNGEAISVGDYVIFYNRLYKVEEQHQSEWKVKSKYPNDPYVLTSVSLINGSEHSLEAAAKDSDGKLTIKSRE